MNRSDWLFLQAPGLRIGLYDTTNVHVSPTDVFFAFSSLLRDTPWGRINTWISDQFSMYSDGTGCLSQAACRDYCDSYLADSIPERISMGLLKRWMAQSESELLNGFEAMKPVENLRFIDCETREIVRAPPEAQYVALSYVWGRSQSEDRTLQSDLPKTIEDAISVTKSLGQKYLWIDRYCIPSEDLKQQISRMHDIYGRAHFTIIAAAGDGPHYGLPGVSSTRRVRPLPVRIGSHLLHASFPSPKLVTEASKWHTRGWTYQEGLLSRRRLVFTDHQVFLQCDHSAFFESAYDYRSPRVHNFITSRGPLTEFFSLSPTSSRIQRAPWDHIRRYSALDLTNPTDAIDGMLGILNFYRDYEGNPRMMKILEEDGDGRSIEFYRNRNFKIRHIAGLPISWRENEIEGVPAGLQWAIITALFWKCKRPSDRRMGERFPSWSWAGWHCQCYIGRLTTFTSWNDCAPGLSFGRLTIEKEKFVENAFRPPSMLLYGENGNNDGSAHVIEAQALEEMLDKKYDFSGAKYLKITAPAVRAKVVHYASGTVAELSDNEQLDNTQQSLALECGRSAPLVPLNLTSKVIFKKAMRLRGVSCLALALDDDIQIDIGCWRDDGVVCLLIVTEKDACFERIGIARVSLKQFRQARPVELSIRVG